MFKTKLSKKYLSVPLGSLSVVSLSVPAFAAADETVVTNMTSAFTGVQETFQAVVTAIGPIAIGIAGIFICWKLGLRFFKSIAK